MHKILAIIPARGGSKRVPEKNIKLLGGKPLLFYSIWEARKSKYIDRVVVSTEDAEIAKIARQFGAEVVDRPQALAQDDSPTLPVLQHVVEVLEGNGGYRPDLVLLLQPTSPFRTAQHIDEAVEKFMAGDCDSLISVKFITVPRFEFSAADRIEPVDKVRLHPSDRKPAIFENGAIYLMTADLLKAGKLFGDKIGYYEMDEASSVDIDMPEDWAQAEAKL